MVLLVLAACAALLYLALACKEDAHGIFGLPIRWLLQRNNPDAMKALSDSPITRAGLPGALPQPDYSISSIPNNIFSWFGWVIGYGHCVDPDSPRRSLCQCLFSLLVFSSLVLSAVFLWGLPYPIGLILISSPWLVYWVVPLPDQVFEYRAYGTIPAIALAGAWLLGSAPIWLITTILTYFAVRSCGLAWRYEGNLTFWASAMMAGSKKARVWINLGAAYQAAGNLATAISWHMEGLKHFPNQPILMANIGINYALMANKTSQDDPAREHYVSEAKSWMSKAYALAPTEPMIIKFHAKICQ